MSTEQRPNSLQNEVNISYQVIIDDEKDRFKTFDKASPQSQAFKDFFTFKDVSFRIDEAHKNTKSPWRYDPLLLSLVKAKIKKAVRDSDYQMENERCIFALRKSVNALRREKGNEHKTESELMQIVVNEMMETIPNEVKVEYKQLPLPLVITRSIEISNVQRVVFKPHGCARQSSSRQEFVITRNDYLTYSHQHTLQMLKTLYDLTTKAFLFLGYSLRDLNMRHIITEARRIGNPKCYAVIQEASAPEARYWKKLGVTLIERDANEYVAKIFDSFPPPAYE